MAPAVEDLMNSEKIAALLSPSAGGKPVVVVGRRHTTLVATLRFAHPTMARRLRENRNGGD
jgi:hypothetical protein